MSNLKIVNKLLALLSLICGLSLLGVSSIDGNTNYVEHYIIGFSLAAGLFPLLGIMYVTAVRRELTQTKHTLATFPKVALIILATGNVTGILLLSTGFIIGGFGGFIPLLIGWPLALFSAITILVLYIMAWIAD